MAYSEKVLRKRKFTKYHDSDDECEEDSSDKDFEPANKKPKAAKPRNKTEAAKEGPKSKFDKNSILNADDHLQIEGLIFEIN